MKDSLSFFGAARTVTGSRHLLQYGKSKVLIDCGLFQGSKSARDRNDDPFPFDPSELDAVVITHAHVDHIGLLPRLVKEGYRGPIYATPATLGIARLTLPDSARLQEEDARHRRKRGEVNAQPLYTEEDAYAALKKFKTVTYGERHDLPEGASWVYKRAGHILGSAMAEIALPDGDILLMSGDLGRYNAPIIQDPEAVDYCDYLTIESTYGNRDHEDENILDKLERIMNDAWQTGSAVLVPSFAIGRTQELLYYFKKLQSEGRMKRIPIFIDSPMAISATQLYAQAKEEHDQDMLISVEEGNSEMEPEGVSFLRDREQSKSINFRQGPMVIISGSGMANGGRIVHHLLRRLSQEETIVLFTGYQAEGTLGRRLLEGEPEVSIMGQEVQVRARIEKLNALSAHADRNEMLKWLGNFKTPPRTTFLVHGEPEAQDALAEKIRAELGWQVAIPEFGDSYDL